jgi:hypothetical protein
MPMQASSSVGRQYAWRLFRCQKEFTNTANLFANDGYCMKENDQKK